MQASAAKLLQSCLTLCDPGDHNPLGSSVHGILQARILEWVATPSSGSSWPRDRTHISYIYLQASGLTEFIPSLCTSAIWSQILFTCSSWRVVDSCFIPLSSSVGQGARWGDWVGHSFRSPHSHLAFLVAQKLKNLVQSLVWEDPLEKGMQHTPVFWPGKFHEQRSLVDYSPWGRLTLSLSFTFGGQKLLLAMILLVYWYGRRCFHFTTVLRILWIISFKPCKFWSLLGKHSLPGQWFLNHWFKTGFKPVVLGGKQNSGKTKSSTKHW